MFDPELVDNYLSQIKAPSPDLQLEGLLCLAEVLITSSPEEIEGFGLSKLVDPIYELFKSSENEMIQEYAALCIRNILSSSVENTYSTIVNSGFIAETVNKLNTTENSGIAENCLHCYYEIASHAARAISPIVPLNLLFKFISFMQTAEQRIIMKTVNLFTEFAMRDEYKQYVEQIADVLPFSDNQTSINAAISLYNIIKSDNSVTVSAPFFGSVSTALNISSNGTVVDSVLNSLQMLNKVSRNSDMIIDSNIDFERLLFSKVFDDNEMDIKNNALILIAYLLPRPNYPSDFLLANHDTPSKALEFSRRIRDVVSTFLYEVGSNPNICIAILTACLSLENFEIPFNTICTIAGLSNNNDNAITVLEFINVFPDKTAFITLDVIKNLMKFKPCDEGWYKTRMDALEKAQKDKKSVAKDLNFKTIKEFLTYIDEKKLKPLDFFSNGMIDIFHRLAKNYDYSSSEKYHFKTLKSILEDICVMLPLNTINDPINAPFEEIIDSSFNVRISYNGRTPVLTTTIASTFGCFEYYVNNLDDEFTFKKIEAAAESNPELKEIIDTSNENAFTYSQYATLCRAFNIPNYKRMIFKYKDHIFGPNDAVYLSLSRLLPNPADIFSTVQTVEVIDMPSDYSKSCNTFATTHSLLSKDLNSIIACFRDIHNIDPTFNLYSEKITKKVQTTIQSINLNVGCFSPGIELVRSMPLLFDTETKIFVFKMTSFDIFSTMYFANRAMMHKSDKFRRGKTNFFCNVRRDNIFEDGIKVLKNFAVGSTDLNISFVGEQGYGSGPTNEFFNILIKKFAKTKRKIFRYDNDKEKYAFTKTGLFPHPNADKEMFYIIGILCAKVIARDNVIALPFSDAFFKLIRGETVKLCEVDKELANSISPEKRRGLIGLDFTYPGIPELELVAGGANIEVTEENVDRYASLIEEFTISNNVTECAKEFRRGFSEVIPTPCFDILDVESLKWLIIGKDVEITLDDLFEGIQLDHGFSASSPQVTMLFDIITELKPKEKTLLIKFITGNERLPMGGIRALQPKISIAKSASAPDNLPSVSTCTNYLKLPSYSSKSVMREKLLLAIYDGQGDFAFS